MDVLGKVIIRGWIDIMRIPTCIILRATSHTEDTFRSTSYPFQICVPRITYCHSQKRFKYHYYEWYIPNELYIGEFVAPYGYYSALSSIVFTNIEEGPDTVHSDYFFGKCASKFKTLVMHDHMKYEDIRGKLIIRRWIDLNVEPNCVYVRANSSYADIVRYHAFKFSICQCRIIYVHQGNKYSYYYYEWYAPVEMMKGIEWDLYFYTS
ncbi:hypothetical protein O3G_MSEX013199 [Manduca sexta]|uniref:Uncharacterized protein n=1 Tax=Manduca sexta TaxID=7130 RepID=A0A922CYW9_MANSE|nr:hypothetical protein O3G_MSEX013199 [Manduca sexta]